MKKHPSGCRQSGERNWRGAWPRCRARPAPGRRVRSSDPGPRPALPEAESAPGRETHIHFRKRRRGWHRFRVPAKDSLRFLLALIHSFIWARKYALQMLWLSMGDKNTGICARKTQEDFVFCPVTKLRPSSHLSAAATRHCPSLPEGMWHHFRISA